METTQSGSPRGRQLVYPVAVLCLLFSGVAGLIYQVVWTRYLALFTGHTSYAIVAVLVAFMGGLALGNAWLGAKADQMRRPLALYGWLELIIGIYALAFPEIYEIAYGSYVGIAQGIAPGSSMLLVLKFTLTLLTLAVPTILMGGTLPILARMVTDSLGELQAKVGRLYFVNSIGAVIGVAVAEFWLINAVGLENTMLAAAVMNLAVGALALFVSGYVREENGPLPKASADSAAGENEEKFTSQEIRMAIVGIGVSGMVAMLYEVSWTRLLGMCMGSSSNAFAIMLMTFILGIAIGAWLINKLPKGANSLTRFGWLEIGVGVSVMVSMCFYEYLPHWYLRLSSIVAREEFNYSIYRFLQGLFSLMVMIVPTTILGMTLPLVSRISTAEATRTGRSVGMVFSFNTVGAVLGTVLTGLWALPTLGLARTFALGAALNVVIGVIIIARNASPGRKRLTPLIMPVAAVWVLIAGNQFQSTWAKYLTYGGWSLEQPPMTMAEFRQGAEVPVLFHVDGAGSSVTVKEDENGIRYLKVNGKADASNDRDMVTQLMLGHVPAMLHPDPKSALVVGLGSGVTSGALAAYPQMEQVTTVEINPEVVSAAEYFNDVNGEVLKDPKLNLVIDDAKSYLLTVTNRYDIIVSEPSNPWLSGVAGVFSAEFYVNCYGRLNSSGLMCQWLHVYAMPRSAIDTVIATFTRIFPHTRIWVGSVGDIMLVGGTNPLEVDLDKLAERFKIPAVRDGLRRVAIDRPLTFLAHELTTEATTEFMTPRGQQLHGDFYPVLGPLAQRGAFMLGSTMHVYDYDAREDPRPESLLAQYLAKHPPGPSDYLSLDIRHRYDVFLKPRLMRSILSRWASEEPDNPLPLLLLSNYKDERQPSANDIARLGPLLPQLMEDQRNGPMNVASFVTSAMNLYRETVSVFYRPDSDVLKRMVEMLQVSLPEMGHVLKCYLAEIAWVNGDMKKFEELATEVFMKNPAAVNRGQFPPDTKSPAIVLRHLLNHYIEQTDREKVMMCIHMIHNGGFVGPKTVRLNAVVERAKALSGMNQPQAQSGQPAAGGQAPPAK